MKKRYTQGEIRRLQSFSKLVICVCLLVPLALTATGQKSYVPSTVTNLPGLFIPNSRILIADFDNDGDKDILSQNGNIQSVDIHYWRNNSNRSVTEFAANGLGNFGAGTPFTGLTFTFIMNPSRSTTGQTIAQWLLDYDADGDQDILEIKTTGTARILLFNAGTYTPGVLSPAFPVSLNNSCNRWITADVDSDGDDDVLLQSGNAVGVGISLLRNDHGGVWTAFAANGSGTFTTGPLSGITFTRIGNTADITQYFFDADGDGDKDLYELTNSSSRYFMRNGGAFTSAALPTGLISSLAPTVYRLVMDDYDKDGDIDLLYQTSNSAASNISYLRNNHNGTFTLSNAVSGVFSGINHPFGSAAFSFISRGGTNREQIMMDVDGDADVDMLQLGTLATSVLLQTGTNLPIKLEYFTVNKRGSQVEVNWKTSEEINVDRFTIEHSVDAINFKSINETRSSGNSAGATYSYIHPNPVKGLQYYRLVELDLDGSKTFFPIKQIQFEELRKPVEIYPTEVTTTITAYFKQSTFQQVQLLDQTGRILENRNITHQQAELSLNVQAYGSGIYYLRFVGKEKSVTERIVKR